MARLTRVSPGVLRLEGPSTTTVATNDRLRFTPVTAAAAPSAAGPFRLAPPVRTIAANDRLRFTPVTGDAAAAGPLRLAPPIRVATTPRYVILTGKPLTVVNASGHVNGAGPLRLELGRTRRTPPAWRSPPANPWWSHTTIRYAEGDLAVAKGLPRTLAIPARLEMCGEKCGGVHLIVGAMWAKTPSRTARRSAIVRPRPDAVNSPSAS